MSKYSKIQLRGLVLQAVLKFKDCNLPNDKEIKSCIKFLNDLDEKEFVVSLLLKEISPHSTQYDSILTLLLFSVSDEKTLSEQIFKLLNDKNISDFKKMHLINILRESGQSIDYNFIQTHIDNPDAIIDSETKKFLQDAQLSPEVLIDFFDFYFTVNADDKSMLVNSIINDYSGDELANILEPFAYFYPTICVDENILNAYLESKSYLALKPLKWCSEHLSDDNLLKIAKKNYKKMLLLGLDKNKKDCEIFSNFLSDSKPMNFWFSCADGNSNISCVFARHRDNGFIQTFFTVFNLSSGPIASFGFNEITKRDFNVILMRFFKSSLHAKISLKDGKTIFDTLASRGWKDNVKIPYEFVCWRRLTYDVEQSSCSFSELLTQGLKKISVNKKVVSEFLNTDLFSSWFFNCKKAPPILEVIETLVQNMPNHIDEINLMVENAANKLFSDLNFKNKFIEKILFQSYILLKSNMPNAANSLYSLTFDDNLVFEFLLTIIKKSLYFYFINEMYEQENISSNIFSKNAGDVQHCDTAKRILKVIEEQWVLKEE